MPNCLVPRFLTPNNCKQLALLNKLMSKSLQCQHSQLPITPWYRVWCESHFEDILPTFSTFSNQVTSLSNKTDPNWTLTHKPVSSTRTIFPNAWILSSISKMNAEHLKLWNVWWVVSWIPWKPLCAYLRNHHIWLLVRNPCTHCHDTRFKNEIGLGWWLSSSQPLALSEIRT